MLAELQGSGKTTTAGKLDNLVRKKHKKKPLYIVDGFIFMGSKKICFLHI